MATRYYIINTINGEKHAEFKNLDEAVIYYKKYFEKVSDVFAIYKSVLEKVDVY